MLLGRTQRILLIDWMISLAFLSYMLAKRNAVMTFEIEAYAIAVMDLLDLTDREQIVAWCCKSWTRQQKVIFHTHL